MTLWEAFSILRDNDEALKSIFGSERWRDTYFDIYSNFDELVRKQDRSALDALPPAELSCEVATRCQKKFYYYPEERLLRLVSERSTSLVELTALETHNRFGDSVIEEVLEYGSVHISSETKE